MKCAYCDFREWRVNCASCGAPLCRYHFAWAGGNPICRESRRYDCRERRILKEMVT